MLGNYPVYPFARELGVGESSIKRVTTWNMTLVEALAERDDIDLHVITGAAIPGSRTLERNGLTVTYLPMPRWPNALSLFRYTVWRARSIINRMEPDVVHGIGTEHIWPLVAVESGRPSVLTVHGVMTNIVAKNPPPTFSKRRYFARLEPRVLKRAQHVISINPYVYDFLMERIGGEIHPVENPVSSLFFRTTPSASEGARILFVGGVERLKGLHILIEALGLLASGSAACPELYVVGPESDPGYSNHVRRMIADKGLTSNVRFLGFRLPEDLADLYERSILLVQPSYEESFSMVCAEAMASGLPVIASNVGGIPHVVEDGVSGMLFPVGDSEKLAAGIHKLMSDKELRKSMGRKGRAIAESRWKPELIAAKTMTVYRAAIDSFGSA